MEWIRSLGSTNSLSPHGICLFWEPGLIWTHVASDLIIAGSYFSIPIALGYFLLKRRDIAFENVFWAFAAFILACGTTHLFSIWTLWVPDYGIEALVKVATAAASVTTAFMLWKVMPRLLTLPSPRQLRRANDALRLGIAERDRALAALELATGERLRAEERLHHAQKLEAMGQLTGGVAHDFNNMLNIVIGNMEMIQRRIPIDDPMHRWVSNAITGSERAAAVTHKLLAFARKQPLCPLPCSVNDLVGNVTDLVRGTLTGGLSLRTDLGAGLPLIAVDGGQFENAILNLVFNARDAMPHGGVVTITTDRSADNVRVAVSDTGCGMAADVAERASEPFFTTKPVGHGTGLGLSQVVGFVRQTGGRKEIETKPGQGTTVTLWFPCIDVFATEAEQGLALACA
ncbi:sensor histidine kinase [uncultured Methylobacterium sp.]|uniref:sensor histidine kinase n=1 Tax=uncultured Methylobacterium sp. TaxID=157278 RepID=UPI0035CA248C